jgi:hypothetical protein
MADKPPTNQRILMLLEEVRAELADAKRREEQLARDVARLLESR